MVYGFHDGCPRQRVKTPNHEFMAQRDERGIFCGLQTLYTKKSRITIIPSDRHILYICWKAPVGVPRLLARMHRSRHPVLLERMVGHVLRYRLRSHNDQ